MVGIIDVESKDRIIDVAGIMEPKEGESAWVEDSSAKREANYELSEDLYLDLKKAYLQGRGISRSVGLDVAGEMKYLLNEIGWSQAHFSRRIGVSEQTLCNWMKPGEHQGGYRVGLAYLRLVERLLNG